MNLKKCFFKLLLSCLAINSFSINLHALTLNQSIQVTEHFFIPLSDGTKLAARMWAPSNTQAKPVPAILEYIPYGKRYGTRCRDESKYNWLASKGYACIRVDLRGSGESNGLLNDEYLPIEQDDAVEVIDWIAQQPWCSGSVGMMGKSWGGFNALQVAARRPAALKAIISVCSTDDRYADDIHYMGGCLLNDNVWWGAIMLAYQARPADKNLIGDEWHKQWINRIEQMPFWPALWLEHQRRDAYWKQGSICEDWNSIQCPVFVIGGWNDAYTNTIPRMLEHLKVPRLGLIGPWAHLYPDDGVPGPAIDFLHEACHWWDYWLKGIDTGIMKEPMLRAYIEEWSPPCGWRDPAPGRWVSEDVWPSQNIEKRTFYFSENSLVVQPQTHSIDIAIKSPQWTGINTGEWMGVGVAGDMPLDQRHDDGCSLTFDTKSLTERLELLGAPELTLTIASDKPLAQICARLCDVAPDGSSRRISYQVLNLTHRDSHETPELLEPGRFYTITIKLNDCGYAFEPNHRLRIALSTTYWPLIWPSPEAATLTLRTQETTLTLPVRHPRIEDSLVHFEKPKSTYVPTISKVKQGTMERSTKLDLLTGKATYVTHGQGGMSGENVVKLNDVGIALSHDLKRELTIDKDDPLSASYLLTQTYQIMQEDSTIKITSNVKMSASKTDFYLSGNLDIFENEIECANRSFNRIIPRDFI